MSTISELKAALAGISGRAVIQTATLTPSADHILQVPAGSPTAGDKARYFITAQGADRNFKVDPAIKIPSDSSFNNSIGKTLTSGKLYIVQIEYSGTFWMLESIVGGYS